MVHLTVASYPLILSVAESVVWSKAVMAAMKQLHTSMLNFYFCVSNNEDDTVAR